ncbi:MAG: TIGR02757 family protein [Bacteroidetes bacterium]|jgi:uncharacterized protein (TIGR02757 family)|nr:TIGR02757 family protein [Bacteroidota bacterium]
MNHITGLKPFLEQKVREFNTSAFIENDPVSIPHLFVKPEDIEISGFLTATISWGQRPVILKNAATLFKWMDYSPHDFILHARKSELEVFRKFVHRTFNGDDAIYFLKALRTIYERHGSMGKLFEKLTEQYSLPQAVHHFRNEMFKSKVEPRTMKHIGDPLKNSACKRLMMFLRWMIREDDNGVDFGIWNISPSLLYCPLDVHSGRVARHLGLLQRRQDDWKAVEELTANLRLLDASDPVKYDFALFGIGVNSRG